MMRINTVFLAIMAASMLAGPAPAVVAPAASTPEAAALAAAREFMSVNDVNGQMHALMPRIAQAASAQMQQQFGENKMPDGLAAQFGAALQAYMGTLDSAFTPQVIDRIAVVYARHFSAADLHHLSALMGDPVMARFRTEMPNVMGDMLPVLMSALKPQQDAFQAKMKQIVADWIRLHPEDKSKLAHPDAS